MVIECLRFKVVPESREYFVQMDEEIWTPALAQNPGFLGKEVWINPDNLTEVMIIIRWESMAAWDSISAETLQHVEARFNEAIGDTYAIVESSRYQVRKFMRRSMDG